MMRHDKSDKRTYVTKEGYKQIYKPNHPNARKNGYVPEHTYVATKGGKKGLKKGQVVHHKDGNKLNNDPKNLVIMTRSEHAKLHNRKCKTSRKKYQNIII